MQYPPVEVLLSYPAPNYVNPIKRGPAMTIVLSILFPVTLVVVGLRIFTRLRISKSFGWDDAVILLAFVPATAFMILGFLCIEVYGSNLHVWDVKPDIIVAALKLLISTQCLFAATSTLSKISMLLLICRIVSDGTSKIRKIAIVAMVLIALDGLTFCLVVIFQCRPISQYWTFSYETQNCVDERVHILISGIINCCSDLICVLLPVPIIMKLNLPFRQKICVLLLFVAGGIVCISGLIRVIFTYKLTTSWDYTWQCYTVWLSSSVELYVGIIGASIPPIKPFFSHYAPKFLESGYLKSHFSFFSNPIRSPQVSGASEDTREAVEKHGFDEKKKESSPEGKSVINVTKVFTIDDETGMRIDSIRAMGPPSPAMSEFKQQGQLSPSGSEFIYIGPREKRRSTIVTNIEAGRSRIQDEEMGLSADWSAPPERSSRRGSEVSSFHFGDRNGSHLDLATDEMPYGHSLIREESTATQRSSDRGPDERAVIRTSGDSEEGLVYSDDELAEIVWVKRVVTRKEMKD